MPESVPPAVEGYVTAVMAVPSLSAEEEGDLWQAAKSGDNADEAKRRIIEANLRHVILIARRYEGRGLVFGDLVQEGNLGLIRAIEKFNPSRDGDFTPFAKDWIDFSIASAVA